MPSRREKSWEPGPQGRVLISGTTATLIGSGAQALQDGLTLLRIRGSLFARLASAAAAGEFMFGAVGIGKVESNAFGAGIASVPSPITDLDWDGWLWWDFLSFESVTDAEALNRGGIAGWRVPIDTKAMRKLDLGDVIYAAVEMRTESGALTASIALDCRMLVALS